eukprot:gene13372-4229_t
MDRGNAGFQDHFNLPLPPIENFTYNEQNGIMEQGQIPGPQHYNFEYGRCQFYGYRNMQDHFYLTQGQHYQEYPQQMEHQVICNTIYQQPHSWNPYDGSAMMPNLVELGHIDVASRARHKRSRMSLQKRLLVNARERERMRVLNKAFEALRDALPCYIADGHMAKITTLRLAINYIKALTEVLEEQRDTEAQQEKSESEMKAEDLDCEDLSLLQTDNIATSNELKTDICKKEDEDGILGKDVVDTSLRDLDVK